MRLRKVIFKLHLCLGLLTGILMTLTGLTGAVLVFRPEIDRLLDRELLHVRPQAERRSLQAVVATVEAKYPGDRVRYVFPPQSYTDSCRVQMAGYGLNVYVDPYSGKVLGAQAPSDTLTGFLYSLHADLLGGELGRTVVGAGGIVLLSLGATGLILWWPGYNKLGRGFRVQWQSGWKRLNFDVHRVLGVLALPFLVVSSLTGTALVFHGFFTDALYGLTGTTQTVPKVRSIVTDGQPLPLDLLVRRADAALPGATVTRVSLPTTPQSPVIVRMRSPGEIHPNGMSFAHIDPYSGKVLAVQDVAAAAVAGQVLNWRYPLHVGVVGGTVTRVVTAVAGLTPAALTVSGYLIWWNRNRVKRRRFDQTGTTI